MWSWRAKAAIAALLAAALAGGIAGAVNLCTLTGNLTLIDGQAGANAQVFFQTISTQSFGGTVIPPSSFSVFTDSQGNLPAGVTVPQGAIVQVTVGSGQPVQIQIPLAATADLATLILANNDPPSVISALSIANGGDYGLSVTNPATGSVGTAVLQPGKVTAIQGFGFSPAAPADAQVPIFSIGAGLWQPESITGDAGLAADGTLAINGIASGGNITGKTSGGPYSISDYNVNNEFNPMQYGAKLDARRVGDMSVVNGSTSVSSNSANFTAADIGKLIVIWTAPSGLGSARTFTGKITAVTAPSAVLSAPYPGPTQSNATSFIGTDDGVAVNTALQAVALNNSGVVKVPGGVIMTTTTLTVAGRSEEFAGQGLGANLPFNGSGTVIVWAGGNQPVIQIVDSYGARVHDFAIMGSDQASTMPSACVDLLNNSSGNLTGHPNSFNVVSNLECGDLSDLSLPGAGNGNATVVAGIEADPSGTQDDRNIIQNVTVKHGIYGIQFGQSQAVEWSVRNLHCDRDGICIDAHAGVFQVEFTQIEDLQSALSFFVGQAAYVTVRNYTDETDGPTTIAPPWAPGFTYPKNFVIKDSNGNFEIASVPGASGGSQPVWAVQSTNFAISTLSRASNVVTVTTTTSHDFSVGQLVGIVNVSDPSFNGTFTVASVPAGNQFTYSQTASNGASSGGSAYHATADNGITWLNTGTATAFAQLALFAGSAGNPGGTLVLADSGWDASNQLPYNADFMAGNNADFTFIGKDFKLVYSQAAPPAVLPIVDLGVSGSGSRSFLCDGCRGITKPNFNVAVSGGDSRQITYIDMQRLPGPNGNVGNAGIGEYFINALVNGDAAGVDGFRYDFPGKLREFGGPLTVQQLANPGAAPFQLSCSDGGSPANNTYLYRYTAVSGTGETLASSAESPVFCTGNIGVGGVSVSGAVLPVIGADSYNIYRTGANGGTGTEKLALSIPANSVGAPALGSNSFSDSTADGSLGRVPPALNSTGNAGIAGVLSSGAAAALGARAGDISAARTAGTGALWLGSNGGQSLDFGITNAGDFTLLGGGLVSPGLSISGSGTLMVGSTTVSGLGACNSSSRFSWTAVTDNNSTCAYGAAPAGSGSVTCPVFCDGSAWKIH
jgi:hypothetical protein